MDSASGHGDVWQIHARFRRQ